MARAGARSFSARCCSLPVAATTLTRVTKTRPPPTQRRPRPLRPIRLPTASWSTSAAGRCSSGASAAARTIDAQPPYVLAGHSFGGIVTQLYTAEHPHDVSGLVLVESNHPDEARRFEQPLTRARIAADRADTQSNPEGIDVFTSLDQARRAGPLPQVPLVVVTATISDGWPPGWNPKRFDRLRAQQQADLADQVRGGQQIFAEGSGHDVPADRPDVVVDAINRVLQ